MKKLFALAATAFLAFSAAAQGTWGIDAAHSRVGFTVQHLVISEADGQFGKFDGSVVSTTADFQNATINFTVDVNSIKTENEDRDNHLKSDDFFNAAQYPQMTFKSKSFKKVKGNQYKLVGDLTIRNVTKQVSFDVTYGGTTKDPWGNTKAGFKLRGAINRMDYGLKWSKVTEAGGAVVGSEVNIVANIELNKAK